MTKHPESIVSIILAILITILLLTALIKTTNANKKTAVQSAYWAGYNNCLMIETK